MISLLILAMGIFGNVCAEEKSVTFDFSKITTLPESGTTIGDITLTTSKGSITDGAYKTTTNASITISFGENITISNIVLETAENKEDFDTSPSVTPTSTSLNNGHYSRTYDFKDVTVSESKIIFTRSQNNAIVYNVTVNYTSGRDVTSPTFTTFPENGATDVSTKTGVRFYASEGIKAVGSDIKGLLYKGEATDGTEITGELEDAVEGSEGFYRTILFSSNQLSLEYNTTTYKIVLSAGQVEDAANNKNEETSVSFTTAEKAVVTEPIFSPEYKVLKLTENGEKAITVTITAEEECKIAYTTDGSNPKNKVPFSESNTVTVTVSEEGATAIKAVAYDEKSNTLSDISIGHYVIYGTHTHLVEGADGTIKPKAITDPDDSVDGIIMTFGGDETVKNDTWKVASKETSNQYIGIQGFPTSDGKYRISSNDTMNEYAEYTKETSNGAGDASVSVGENGEFNHDIYMGLETTHEKTFYLPAYGNYFMFEPEYDGELTVYVEQQGGINTDSNILYPKFIRKRPVYIFDETGTSVTGVEAVTSSVVNLRDWEQIKRDELADKGETDSGLNSDYKDAGKSKEQTMYTKSEAQAIYDVYDAWIKRNKHDDNVIEQEPLLLHNNGYEAYDWKIADGEETTFQDLLNKINGGATYNDNTGYMLISEGFVSYKFPVKAGKTYFMFGYRTKLGFVGYTYIKDADAPENTQLTLDETATDNASKITSADKDLTYDVTVKRSFKANEWASLVLPFSVGPQQLKTVFGDDVEVIHFKDMDMNTNTLNLKMHFHQMIVGGTPVFIKPSKNVNLQDDGVTSGDGILFENVTLADNADIDLISNTSGGKTFTFRASYDATTMPAYSFYMGSGTNSFYQWTADLQTNGLRAWITGAEEIINAKVNGFDDDNTTGISGIREDDGKKVAKGNLYNLNGQIVRAGTNNLEGLAKGIYIMGGKKVVVK